MAPLRDRLPWWAKVGLKLLMARLPVTYRFWRAIGVCRHTATVSPAYAITVFDRHFEASRRWIPDRFSVLELGPGDSLASAIIAAVRGSERTYLVDAAPFASGDIASYTDLLDDLQRRGYDVRRFRVCSSVDEILKVAGATYLVEGLRSLAAIPSQSVDLVFSQAVLEHVRRREFDATMQELFRVQRPGGIASHSVDLQDHLAHSLHSLRFASEVWESDRFTESCSGSSGFYTNRLRAPEIERALTAAGYVVVEKREERWDHLPVLRRAIHEEFQRFTDDELRVSGLDIVVRKPR